MRIGILTLPIVIGILFRPFQDTFVLTRWLSLGNDSIAVQPEVYYQLIFLLIIVLLTKTLQSSKTMVYVLWHYGTAFSTILF